MIPNPKRARVVVDSVADSTIFLQTQSTGGTPSGGSSGGVPGYTYEEITAGIVLGVVVIVWARAIMYVVSGIQLFLTLISLPFLV